MKMPWIVAVSCLILSLVPNSASAQLRQGDTRLSIDADLLSVSWVKLVPDRERPARRQTIVGLGPNQLGASEVALPSAPLGFGFGYVLRPKVLLVARAGFGFDRVSADDDATFSHLTSPTWLSNRPLRSPSRPT